MKKCLLSVCLSLIIASSVKAAINIAIINIDHLFQEVAQKTGVSLILEKEFNNRANELQRMEDDLKSKIQYLQRDTSAMKESDRNKLEKDVISQRQLFSQKAQDFERDRQRRSKEERTKLLTHIEEVVKSVATDQKIDLILNTNAVSFNNSNVKDITTDVLNRLMTNAFNSSG